MRELTIDEIEKNYITVREPLEPNTREHSREEIEAIISALSVGKGVRYLDPEHPYATVVIENETLEKRLNYLLGVEENSNLKNNPLVTATTDSPAARRRRIQFLTSQVIAGNMTVDEAARALNERES